jgi:hypothetical protein
MNELGVYLLLGIGNILFYPIIVLGCYLINRSSIPEFTSKVKIYRHLEISYRTLAISLFACYALYHIVFLSANTILTDYFAGELPVINAKISLLRTFRLFLWFAIVLLCFGYIFIVLYGLLFYEILDNVKLTRERLSLAELLLISIAVLFFCLAFCYLGAVFLRYLTHFIQYLQFTPLNLLHGRETASHNFYDFIMGIARR